MSRSVRCLDQWLLGLALSVALAALVAGALLTWQTHLGNDAPAPTAAPDAARGAYLARVGNCAGCHTDTARAGAPLAGGRGIPTPFGTVFSTNLTPDRATGLGDWSADDFWRALHLGQGRDGHLLTPAFPYLNTTRVSRADSDAIWAWLRSQPAVVAPRREHELRWPYRTQLALAAWRALYFRPADPTSAQPRGAYLVQGLAHCSACHGARNALGGGGGVDSFDGGLLFGLGWVAPSLHDPAEAGVQAWSEATLRRWLRDGHAQDARGSHTALGPMAEVVLGTTSALNDDDLAAVSAYLRALPVRRLARADGARPSLQRRELGAELYRQHCADCHGAQGEGRRGAAGAFAYPPLAGNRSVTQASAANLLRVIERGAFAAATPGHPQPYGMPPFAGVLGVEELAALASFLRTQWGHAAGEVDSVEVVRLRAAASTP